MEGVEADTESIKIFQPARFLEVQCQQNVLIKIFCLYVYQFYYIQECKTIVGL